MTMSDSRKPKGKELLYPTKSMRCKIILEPIGVIHYPLYPVMLIAELGLSLWLLMKGVKNQKVLAIKTM
jgi:hypothetical protein